MEQTLRREGGETISWKKRRETSFKKRRKGNKL